jgi:hypothetical protein
VLGDGVTDMALAATHDRPIIMTPRGRLEELVMTRNIGTIDRILRIVGGLLLIAFALGFIFPDTGYNWLGWIGVVPLATAAMGTCPAYSILGISSCPAKTS